MNDNIRVIDYVKDIAEYIATKEGRISASQMLEQFLFTPDMQYAPIGKLSGGEKRRLYLLGVLAQSINLLLIDEPGNNLDIPTMTILEDYLNSFPGIVITVSHDRYFLDNIADRILELDGNGHITQYEGGYTDYLEAKKREQAEIAGSVIGNAGNKGNQIKNMGGKSDNTSDDKKTDSKNWKQQQQVPQKLKFSYKEQKEYETIDEDIAKLEAAIEKLEEDMMKNATNSVKLAEIIREKALHALSDEIPHGIAVGIDQMKERKGIIDIDATIVCERDSHKGIIIGKQGAMLKKIGTNARYEMERLLDTKVNLKLWVKVKKDWRDSDFLIKNFGYREE